MIQNLTSRILKILQNMPKGTHLCHFYQTPQDMLDVLVPYFAAGLEGNERCLWIVDGVLTVAQAKEAMAAAVPGWEEHLANGRIEFFEHTDWYLCDGRFDETRVLQQYIAKEAEALEAGFGGLRISGNTLWARDRLWSDLLEYERHVDQCFCKHSMTAICTYPLDGCSGADIVDVAKAHELVLIRREGIWDVIESATLRQMREELHESHERLKSLTQQIVQVEQEERRRISQALHDGLQQTIVGTQLNLARAKTKSGIKQVEALELVASLLDEALEACRTLTTEISPPILHERGLLPALKWLASWFEKQHRLGVRLHLPADEPPLGESERVTLFEVARELLFNVVKHAGVREAEIFVQVKSNEAELIVADQGTGCNSSAIETTGTIGHFGLSNIRERLRMMDGDFAFESAPGNGTKCAIHLPLARSEVPENGIDYAATHTLGSGKADSGVFPKTLATANG
jgi:signal transduction histidine kinase